MRISRTTHNVVPILAAFVLLALPIQAQTFTVLHSFAGGADGDQPLSGVSIDVYGNLYGTTFYGGNGAGGIAYKLSPHGGSWRYSQLRRFSTSDGSNSAAKLLIDSDGTLYGVSTAGGTYGHGAAFRLRPPARGCAAIPCFWDAIVVHNFSPSADGSYAVGLNFDAERNIVGATSANGPAGLGTVFKMTRSQGSWTFDVITGFGGTGTGTVYSGVIADQSGNLYGGGYVPNPGTVFKITTSGQVQILHQFSGNDGVGPLYLPVLDANGNLYGMTLGGGPNQSGTVYELSPSGGNWSFDLLYAFSSGNYEGTIGSAGLSMDAQGNLYGTRLADGAYGYGTVFKLSPSPNGWIYTDLHDFTGGDDGCYPWSDVVMDSTGNLYGTASACGGTPNAGTVWEITP